MQCRECGATIAVNVSFCPTCGARQVSVAPPAASAPVATAPLAASQAPRAAAVPAPRAASAPSPAPSTIPAPSVGKALATEVKIVLPHMGDTFANRYRIEKYLGLGALANTYLCRDLANGNQEMVLKIMHARKSAEAGLADSYIFLAESVAKYDHKGIARIFDAGRHEGLPYYTMEWVGGVPLRLWLMERLNFENRVLPGLGIIVALLDTFETIHERGCYGCVKPENVFITLNGPVIMDFGVVGFLSSQEFEFNSYARRYLPYMAPELRQDWSNLLPHSDYYSIGAILYEVLVGRVPAPHLRLPSELSGIFGIEADEIVLKAMAPKPLDRFGTVEAFKNAVISLQASLLNARPQDAFLPASAAPQAHPGLELTSDLISVHNPDEAFEDPETGTIHTPGTGTLPVGFGVTPPQPPPGAPWTREPGHAQDLATGEAPGDAAHTVFYGKTPPEDDGRTVSDFSPLGDRVTEAAHAQRRFVHAPGPLGEASPFPADAGLPEDALAALPEIEEEATPVPAWLWVSIALAGSCMVVLSAYFGLLHGH